MGAIRPPKKPVQSRDTTAAALAAAGVRTEVALVGVRGYYRDTMGARGKNDRGIYDDAIFVVTPNVCASFNANTDPSIARDGVAVLQPGVWSYRPGIHGRTRPAAQRYPALVQAAPVTVLRDGGEVETGMLGINIHRGGRGSTSSLGCQTIWPDQWDAFLALVKSEMARHGQRTVPYLLLADA